MSIRKEGDGSYPLLICHESSFLFPLGNIPKCDGPIVATRSKLLTIWGEAHTPQPRPLSVKHRTFILSEEVPEPDAAVERRDRKGMSIGREINRRGCCFPQRN